MLLVEVFDMGYLQGNIIAFFLIQIFNYALSRKWVFQSTANKKRVEFPVFMIFVGCGFAINQAGLWFFADTVGIRYEIAKVIAIILVVIWNFFTRRFIVFKKIMPKP
jgi:putative flippase GtrA